MGRLGRSAFPVEIFDVSNAMSGGVAGVVPAQPPGRRLSGSTLQRTGCWPRGVPVLECAT